MDDTSKPDYYPTHMQGIGSRFLDHYKNENVVEKMIDLDALYEKYREYAALKIFTIEQFERYVLFQNQVLIRNGRKVVTKTSHHAKYGEACI
jgi:GTPase involved in cell partitioning and DNA repair